MEIDSPQKTMVVGGIKPPEGPSIYGREDDVALTGRDLGRKLSVIT